MNTVLRTEALPVERDFYLHLRPLVSTLQTLLQPAPGSTFHALPNKSPDPLCASFKDSHLRRCLDQFHDALTAHSKRDPDFLVDSNVVKFLTSVHRVVGYLESVPSADWTLWYNPENAQLAEGQGAEEVVAFPCRHCDEPVEVDDPVILPVDVASDGEKAPSTSRGSKRPFYAAMQTGHHPQTHKSSSPFPSVISLSQSSDDADSGPSGKKARLAPRASPEMHLVPVYPTILPGVVGLKFEEKKPKPASTAGRAPGYLGPLASSARRQSSIASFKSQTRPLQNFHPKAPASVSDADDGSDPSVIEISPPAKYPRRAAVGVSLNEDKRARRRTPSSLLAAGFSEDADRATFPAPDAVTADILEMLPRPRQPPRMQCTRCMHLQTRKSSTVCEFRGSGLGCGPCSDIPSVRCSFELSMSETSFMVDRLFAPWKSQSLTYVTRLTGQINHNSSMLQRMLTVVAGLESSLINDARELRSVCAELMRSASVRQISYMFDPPSLLASLADIDIAALEQMDAALSQSAHLPTAPEEKESIDSQAGSSRSTSRSSTTGAVSSPVTDVFMAYPPVAVLLESPLSPEAPKDVDDEPLEEYPTAMSGVEGSTVGDDGTGAAED